MSSALTVHVLLALATVVIASHVVGRLVARFGQPPVVGEVLAGILLGPSLLGRVAPGIEARLFPESARPALGVVAQLGVVLYMFVLGLDFDPASLRRRAAPYIFTSQVSIALPFLLGCAFAFALFPAYGPTGVPFIAFALFMGIAMSITAFPVLARILTDRGLARSELGTAALTCAAINDLIGWCLLGVVVGVARATIAGALVSALLAVAFTVFMFAVGRPIAARLAGRVDGPEDTTTAGIAWTLALMLVSAVVAESIGLHAIFGAFLFGAILPPGGAIARRLHSQHTPVVTAIFLPAFFALTGLRTEIGLVATPGQWAVCLSLILLATAGKFGGTFAAARIAGMPWRFAAALGILMNTRGLMELVVLNVGVDIGVISPPLFAMMVIMAIVTTAMTGPMLSAVSGRSASPPGADDHRQDREEDADA